MKNQHLIETEISSQTIYEGRVVNLYLQQVRLPNGQESQREIIIHPGAVAIVPVLEDGQVILVRQYRKAANKVLLEVPAGTLNGPEEDIEAAANRELQEEIGYRANSLKRLGGIYVAPSYSSEYIHLFLAQDLIPDSMEQDEDEFIETVTIPLDEAMQKILYGEIADAKSVSSLMLAHPHLVESYKAKD